mmetsp:Transcript_5055/g.751  ORF Transcript_5055/g.751 Transcript_5055/m.751 type:complete len:102 (-) Transcript_5055:194-499(-)
MLNFWASGTMAYGMVVVIVNLKVFIVSFDHTFISIFFNLGSMLLYLLTILIMDKLESSKLSNLFNVLMTSPNFHMGNILGIVATSLAIDFSLERWIRGNAK